MIGLVFRPKGKPQVMKISEKDHRYVDFNIHQENAFSVECEDKKGYPPQRFLKFAASYTGEVGKFLKRTRTRFLGKEGTAYTWNPLSKGAITKLLKKEPKQQEVKRKTKRKRNPKTVDIKGVFIGSLARALRGLWGDEFYFEVPEAKRKELEDSKVNVTVELEQGLTPEGYQPATEEDFNEELDRKAAKTWWEGKDLADKGKMSQWLFIFGAGIGAGWIINTLLGVV